MLFQSSIRHELTRTFSATLFVLVIIVMTMMLIRTLNFANQGAINPSEVSLVLGFTVLAYFPTILTLSLFISIVYTLSRMYRDSEMAVWFSSGQGLFQFIRPLLQFTLPVVLVVAVLSLVGWPWANAQTQELRQRYQTRGDVDRIAPGQFQESSDGNRVFYIDGDDRSATSAAALSGASAAGRKLFIFARQPKSEQIVTAKSGQVKDVGNSRFAVLTNGQSTEIADDHTLTVSRFQEYGIRIGDRSQALHGSLDDPQTLAATPPRAIPTLRLLQLPAPQYQGELGWRISMALAGINFMLLALASSKVNPRSGRSGSLVLALLFFTVYYNLINFAQDWITRGRIDMPRMLLLLHGGIFALAMLWIWMRHNQWSLHRLLPRRPVPAGEGRQA